MPNILNLILKPFIPIYVRADGSKIYSWGETDTRYCRPRITVNDWDTKHSTLSLGLLFIAIYIHLPKLQYVSGFDAGQYGFYFDESALVLCWGKANKFLYYPWSWDYYKHWEYAESFIGRGIWVEIPRGLPSGRVATTWRAPYAYTLHDGTTQKRIADYYLERREWRWRWLMGLPWPRLIRTSLWVTFNDEIGEGTGSYKGGVTGCGFDLLPGETPAEALARMERTRVFGR